MTVAYDPENIFAKILRGEAPSVRLYEDEACLAFMDVMPRGPGHLLVIPKSPARNILDISSEAFTAIMPAVRKLAIAAKTALEADGVSIHQFSEPASGQVVYHLHVHIIPHFDGVALKPPGGPMSSAAELEPVAAKIRAALAIL